MAPGNIDNLHSASSSSSWEQEYADYLSEREDSPSVASTTTEEQSSAPAAPSKTREEMEAENKRASNAALQQIATRLLAGWKMRSELCPMNCHTPLLESRAGEIWCSKCNAMVLLQSTVDRDGLPPHPPAPPSRTQMTDIARSTAATGEPSLSTPTIIEEEEEDSDDDEEAVAITRRILAQNESKGRRDVASEKIGAKLLAGWTMLEGVCSRPGCVGVPLMRAAPGEPPYCVACDGQEAGNGHAPPPPGVVEEKEEEYDDDDDMDEEVMERMLARSRMSSTSKTSEKLGAKLLAGWTMLAECCVRDDCIGVPLMRLGPLGREYCVGCERFVLDEEAGQVAPVAAPPPAAVVADVVPEQQPDIPAPLDESEALSKHLLGGWTMLGRQCPQLNCTSPLMRERATQIVKCVQPGCPGVKDESTTLKRKTPVPPPVAPTAEKKKRAILIPPAATGSNAVLTKLSQTRRALDSATSPAEVLAAAEATVALCGALGSLRQLDRRFGSVYAAGDDEDVLMTTAASLRSKLETVMGHLATALDLRVLNDLARALTKLSDACLAVDDLANNNSTYSLI